MKAPCRSWLDDAIRKIEADAARSADTHLIRLPLSATPGITLYFKDESTHPTGSLKHRLARSLFLYALCNGWIGEGTTIVEASSGSTAVSEAYFARMLGLAFIAVMPAGTSPAKVALIEREGGRCEMVADPAKVGARSRELAADADVHFMDQFTYAERATDWRGNNNIAESIFSQMALEDDPIPRWIVCGAGTGGTSATLGRYVRYRHHATRICLADPERSVFHRRIRGETAPLLAGPGSLIEGIGRPRVEPSFMPDLIDRCEAVSDASSIAAARFAAEALGRPCGGSTGSNLWVACGLAAEMAASGTRGSIVTLLCDSGTRYAGTYFDDAWVNDRGLDLAPHLERLQTFMSSGKF